MSQIRVSVIIPACNAGKYLAETLDSVLAQTVADWECLVVDDGSADDTSAVAREYCARDPRIRLIEQRNSGVAAARNNAIRHATGEFLLPLDADDKIAPTYMEKALAIFGAQPDVKLVYSKARFFDAVEGPWDLEPYDYTLLTYQNHIFCTSFIRRQDAIDAGLYDETFRTGYEDWDFLLRLLTPESKVVRLDEELFFYRQHQGTSVNTRAKRDEKPLLETIAKKYPGIYGTYREKIIHDLRKAAGRRKRHANRIRFFTILATKLKHKL